MMTVKWRLRQLRRGHLAGSDECRSSWVSFRPEIIRFQLKRVQCLAQRCWSQTQCTVASIPAQESHPRPAILHSRNSVSVSRRRAARSLAPAANESGATHAVAHVAHTRRLDGGTWPPLLLPPQRRRLKTTQNSIKVPSTGFKGLACPQTATTTSVPI